MSDTRKTAVIMLQDILEKRIFFSEVKAEMNEKEIQDTAFINMLVLTSLRHLVYIRKVLKQFVKKKLPEKVAFAEFALISATAEILYLNTPDYAVLNSYVDLIKKNTDKYVSGFANAVLRKVCAQKERLQKEDIGEFFPAEFFRILNLDYSKKTVSKIQSTVIQEPSLDLTLKDASKEWAEKLGGKLLGNGSLRLNNEGRITDIEGFKDGSWWVQDVAASLAVQALGNIKGKKVLDLCAAPGGKTAQLINAGAKTSALDISENRLETLQQNMERLRLKPAEVICADAIEYFQNNSAADFDIILLDAPCSATGTIRRHPELVHIKRIADVEKQAQLQKEILKQAAKALKKDGILLYCTCSISKLEGEAQIGFFLEENPDFKIVPITEKDINVFEENRLNDIITEEGYIRTLPHHIEGGMDSFFIAKLQKVK